MPFVGVEFDSVEEARSLQCLCIQNGFQYPGCIIKEHTVTKELIRKEFKCTHARRPDSE